MPKKEILLRYLLFLLGLWICSFGIGLSTKSELGVSSISSVPYVLSAGLPLSMGTFTFIFNMLFVIGQMALLGKAFEKLQLLQILVLLVFGYFIDLTLTLLSVFRMSNYYERFICMLLGCAVLALGISIQIIANIVLLSGDALIKVIAFKLKREFGMVKVCFDTSIVIIACILSFGMLHKIVGVREGTLIAALTIGFLVRFFHKRLAFIERWLVSVGRAEKQEEIED